MRHYVRAGGRPFSFFFFNDTATTEIYTLSLHDALPIYISWRGGSMSAQEGGRGHRSWLRDWDRKSTRLNSKSHSDLVCRLLLEKKKKTKELLGIKGLRRTHFT